MIAAVTLVWSAYLGVSVIARSTVDVDFSAPAAGITEVLVEVEGGSVEIRGGAFDQVRVTGSVLSGPTRTRHHEAVVGSVLVVQSECTGGVFSTTCAVDHVIEVPVSAAVVVRAANTKVVLSDISGPVDLQSTNEPIRADRLSGAEIAVQTTNAPIELGAVSTGRMRLRTSNESVRTEFARPVDELDIATSSAEVDVVLPEGPTSYAVGIDSPAGSQSTEVRTDPTSEHRILIRTSNSDVTVRYPEGQG